jgi:hypothetical protein
MRDAKGGKKNIMRTVASSAHASDPTGPASNLWLVIDSATALIDTAMPDGYLDFQFRPLSGSGWIFFDGLVIPPSGDVDDPYQHSPEKCSAVLSSEAVSQVRKTAEDDDPTDQNGDANTVANGNNTLVPDLVIDRIQN